jgi:nucleoside-diphosphate-sugar epimerase
MSTLIRKAVIVGGLGTRSTVPVTTRIRKAVVVGDLGITGRAVIEHIATRSDWKAVAVSRRTPDFETPTPFVAVDLLDRADCEAKLSQMNDATDIVYAAHQPRATRAEPASPNLAMLRNAVEVLARSSPGLRHVCLIQGGKAYDAHRCPARTPAKESDPSQLRPEFCCDLEHFLCERSAAASWTWSALRPEATSGLAVANPMNLLMIIGVYAAMCREFGVPFRFPGTPDAYRALYQMTDARILARAVLWSATEPRCAGEVFNITNGDCFRWENVWPRLAAFFGLDCDEPHTFSLAEFMADKGPIWGRIVERNGLRPYPFEQIVAWEFGDAVFASEHDKISSTVKARRCGFTDCIDTEDMFFELFTQLEERRILPLPPRRRPATSASRLSLSASR